MRTLFAGIVWMVALAAGVTSGQEVPYGVADKLWEEGLGAHRAVIRVENAADAVLADIPWRRRDRDPARKALIVAEAASGQRVSNVAVLEMTREAGRIVFQPRTPGEYFVYFLPYTPQPGWGGYGGDYVPPKDTADAGWREKLPKDPAGLPRATVARFEARTAFDSFHPMEVIATQEETRQLLARHDAPYLLFPEDRRHPIRMADDLPLRWTKSGPGSRFRGEAQRNEFYAFQIGVYAARQDLEQIAVEFGGPRAAWLKCFNTGGVNWDGRPLQKMIRVPRGRVQALWIGVDVPRDADAGEHAATVTIRPRNAPPATVEVTLSVLPQKLSDRGDSEPWRHSRLRWLDSTLGIDDEPVAPYPPLQVDGATVRCLGRTVRFGNAALPESIRCGEIEVLASPPQWVIETANGAAAIQPRPLVLRKQAPGIVQLESDGEAGPLTTRCAAAMEFDGHIGMSLRLEAREATKLRDVRLELPLRPEAATYLMGIGRRAEVCPREYTWKWQGPYDSFWIGDVHAGLHCEFRGGPYHGPMLNLYPPAPPPSWHNAGRGGISLASTPGGPVQIRAFSGERELAAGESITFELALLPTPVKPLDTARHFREHYFHHTDPDDASLAAGINVINVHHATHVNPYINYPFLTVDRMREYVRPWHDRGAKVKFYYTVRELSNHTVELWALRSLGVEALAGGGGGGFPWLREHLGGEYTPQWYNVCADGVTIDAALLTSGASRWYNYYVEGLSWLVNQVPIDGLYLDDVTYDRTILRRMRKVMERQRPGCLIDLHSNTAFSIGPANQYAEFFPYVDRLWFGESFDYDAMTPAQWLVETSGIPFGLMGDMLQGGGNRWRGMVYGMTARAPAEADPKPVWRVWNEFGIADARMIGYWEKSCPVRTDHKDVLATVYRRDGRSLVALASWAAEPVNVRLQVDWPALGLDPAKAKIRAPAIADFQPNRDWTPSDAIPVEPRRGWLVVLE